MPLEIRPTDKPEKFDLYDETGRIGEIVYVPEAEQGVVDPGGWDVTLWSMTGSGKEWTEAVDTLEEAKKSAHYLHSELVTERRAANQPGPGPRPTTISTPMGGQQRRR